MITEVQSKDKEIGMRVQIITDVNFLERVTGLEDVPMFQEVQNDARIHKL